MKCPTDGSDLLMMERQNVEIDYCPQCRGVWLDRGELDKIIERSMMVSGRYDDDDDRRPPAGYKKHDDDYYYDQQGKPFKKKKSFLGDIFDFD